MNITKRGSTKPERILADALIRAGIPFEFRKLINNREIDFLIGGKLVVECDGVHHKRRRKKQLDSEKDTMLLTAGYSIFRFSAYRIRKDLQGVVNRIKEHDGITS